MDFDEKEVNAMSIPNRQGILFHPLFCIVNLSFFILTG